jgi:hypothetical protein
MTSIEKPKVPLEAVEAKLAKDDDRDFWQAALLVLTDEFLQRYDRESKGRIWIFDIGACSHWVRPHQERWTVAGGFAWPKGYNSFSPELDWSVILAFQNYRWIPVKKFSGKRETIFRVAVPARSARHKQAVVHSRWIPGAETVFYGFRNLDRKWKCVAASDEDLRGKI